MAKSTIKSGVKIEKEQKNIEEIKVNYDSMDEKLNIIIGKLYILEETLSNIKKQLEISTDKIFCENETIKQNIDNLEITINMNDNFIEKELKEIKEIKQMKDRKESKEPKEFKEVKEYEKPKEDESQIKVSEDEGFLYKIKNFFKR